MATKRKTDPAHTHDADAERAIIGAILLDGPDSLAAIRAAGGLPVTAIYVEEHARILAAIYALDERG
jgi:replicative DNA helicase